MTLDEYLKAERIRVPEFAAMIKVTHATIYNLMKGKDVRGSILAKIEIVTSGKVKGVDCVHPDLIDIDPPKKKRK